LGFNWLYDIITTTNLNFFIWVQSKMEYVQRIKKTFQTWGIKRPVLVDGKLIGYTAPLWKNISPAGFLILGLLDFALFFSFILVYVFVVAPVSPCTPAQRVLIILQIVFLGFNWLYDIRFFLEKVASDEQWSRNLIKTSCNFCIMTLLAIISLLLVPVIGSTPQVAGCDNSSSTNPENQVNLALSLLILFLSCGRLVLILYLYNGYYRSNKFLAYRSDLQ